MRHRRERGAFLASFYFSGSTIIYYLLRREVDATDFVDIYLEESEESEEQQAPPAAPPSDAPPPAEEQDASAPVDTSPPEPEPKEEPDNNE